MERIQTQANLPTTPVGLKEAGNDAINKNNFTLAVHMYTLGIDLASQGLPRNEEGVAASPDLWKRNQEQKGELAKLLANRALAHLKRDDPSAALEDAYAATICEPAYEKAHVRVLNALEALKAPVEDQLAAVERGLLACGPPGSASTLEAKVGLLRLQVTADAKKQGANAAPLPHSPNSTGTATSTAALPPAVSSGPPNSDSTSSASNEAPLMAAALAAADDLDDPRRVMAAADVGAAYAVGAYGLPRDVERAEAYLIIGADGGDITAIRNLGLLLLELNRSTEAAARLQLAAIQGDEASIEALQQLGEEAKQKSVTAKAKLQVMANNGDTRAAQMLREFEGKD